MAENVQHFAVKTIGVSTVNGRKPCTLMEAGRHNLREIQAELGARGHIDPKRTTHNTIMAGPDTAAGVKAHADDLLAQVDTSKLKRDHVQAVEVVFSLPPGSGIDPMTYFARCLEWLRQALPLPVLLATAHRDEAAPHLHVLLLPVKDGKHIGGAANTRPELKRLRESFFKQVSGPAGLKRDGAKVRGIVKQWAVAAVLERCEGLALPAAMGPLWAVFVAAIQRDPTTAMLALNVDVNTVRPSSETDIPNPIGLQARPIGLQKEGQKHQALSCVGLHQQTTLAAAQKAALTTVTEPPIQPDVIDTLASLWAAVGCRSNWVAPTKAERLRHAREAQQRAIERHARCTPVATNGNARSVSVDHGDDLTREHDELAHDTSAWAD